MGTIAGFLSRNGPPDGKTMLRMLRASPHRGARHVVETMGAAALAVCNEADRTTATLARDSLHLVVFCGALDNDGEVRRALRRAGAPSPLDHTPAATLLAGFSEWGEDAVRRLRGSFVGAVTDGRGLLCFRDHFGTRPLFFHTGAAGCFVASEVKQVLEGAALRREPDLDHLHRVLFGGIEHSTAFQGVERVPARTIASMGRHAVTGSDNGSAFAPGFRCYWNPGGAVATAKISPAEAVEGTVDALRRAVHRMMTGEDVILLSGGLDSPSLAAFANSAEGLASPVQAVTSIYPCHPSVDEREWTRMAADHVGIPLHCYVAEAGSLDDVEHWTALLDGPVSVFSSPESAEAYRAARLRGGRTVLTGEIAETLFESRSYLLPHLLRSGRLRAAARVLGQRRRGGRTPLRLAKDVAYALAPQRLLPHHFGGEPAPHHLRGLPPWVDRGTASTPPSSSTSSAVPPVSPGNWWVECQTSAFAGPGIGFEADEICAASCGVDVRRPFTDVDLWEFVLSLPAEVKFPGHVTKPLLRKAMRGRLPDPLIDRKDKTFFDEFHLATADYPTLKRLLEGSRHRLEGFDYPLLHDHLEAGQMRIYELQWARNVARVHAFLDQWR
jgi:asparagine synthase (glutamine-hydrolysing)